MVHYDMYRMGWQQFEHMVQSFAKDVLGNGLRPFGSGRDGQREADFRGRVAFPVGAGRTWNGHGVVQAKYREQHAGTLSDSKWFLGEVQKELKRWQLKKLQSKNVPSYLLFATNVSLSGVEEVGGKDQFETTMQRWSQELGLRGWYVWDYSELRTMLDNNTDIRKRYLEQIITGDLLEELRQLLPQPSALEIDRLAAYTVSELTSRQWVRTGDVGYGDGSKMRLADIAVDLPCSIGEPSTGPKVRRYKAAAAALARGNATYTSVSGRGPAGVVLVGGPGQGKSTLCQLVAHTYRLAFLAETDLTVFGPKAEEAVLALRSRLAHAEISMPVKRRWPVLVELAKVGAAISRQEGTFSLLHYLASQLNIKGRTTPPASLLDWMKSWPICLILDGLDEVPDSRVRAELVAAIGAFATDAAGEGVDLFIIASSRPQGYNGEFGEAVDCSEFRLVELTETEALAYSEALTGVRQADDPFLADQVTDRLITAVHGRVTQKLMTTPLQVTIMTALAEDAVDLPSDRFELFDRYYRVVYDREVSKPGAVGELKTLRGHIDHLHEEAGVRLQRSAQRPSGSDPVVAKREIRKLLARRLSAAGFEDSDADSLAEKLIRLSTERLVLLVSRRTGKYEFDVRSLQEYMAARALTTGEDAAIITGLRQLLPVSHWRNTWLLAAERLLSKREHLGEPLVEMITEFDQESVEASITCVGADLARELYLDNFATEFPRLRRALLSSALTLFSDPSPELGPVPRRLLEAVKSTGDSREQAMLLEALHLHARADLSSLAAKVLSDNSTGMDDLAKQARITLSEGRRYVRPRSLTGGESVVALRAALEAYRGGNAGATALLDSLEGVRPFSTEGVWVPVDLLQALEADDAREILVRLIRRLKSSRPEVARYATLALRTRMSRPTI
ncbi:NACHT domain-containing protein [Microbacterium sp. LMI1-1-1.1]|uniref:NACHT domain-containing protein n=1 Tax=Microbacterium sp. LMI1-1-1.1 TaxID=3135223 RepID=UPI0034661411